MTQLHTYHCIAGRQQEHEQCVQMCACMRVYSVTHILSPEQIKPLPTIRPNDKREEGSTWSPDGRLRDCLGTRGVETDDPRLYDS